MSSEIHGHEVMNMMIESGRRYTRPELITAIAERFGAEARFFTCLSTGLSAEDLVSFLEGKGKFIAEPEGYSMSPERMCQH